PAPGTTLPGHGQARRSLRCRRREPAASLVTGRPRRDASSAFPFQPPRSAHHDTAAFRKTPADQARAPAALREQARAPPGIPHPFGIGDGFVVAVDEWESPQQFEQFFARPELQAFINASGASGPPEITISEAITSPDQY